VAVARAFTKPKERFKGSYAMPSQQVFQQSPFVSSIWIERTIERDFVRLVTDQMEIVPHAASQQRKEIPELLYPGTFGEMGRNTYGEVEPGEYSSGFPHFVPQVPEKYSQVADQVRCGSDIVPVRTEGSLRTPSLRGIAAPVGVVYERRLIHECILIGVAGELLSLFAPYPVIKFGQCL
jgi:hypothetical protein